MPNHIRAGLVKKQEAWKWSSAGPHVKGKDDLLVKAEPLRELVQKSWRKFLAIDVTEAEIDLLRKHERTGRPIGKDSFIKKMERHLNRTLRPQKPGPKKEKVK